MGVSNIKKKFFSTDFGNLVTKVNNGIGNYARTQVNVLNF